jgi:endo-1,3(4)-beta-glucanase
MMHIFVFATIVTNALALYPRTERESLLDPVALTVPDPAVWPRKSRTMFGPVYTEVSGAKSTNKFWGNWIVGEGWLYSYFLPLYTMPYAIRWKQHGNSKAGQLAISHSQPLYFKEERVNCDTKGYPWGCFEPPTDNHVLSYTVFNEELAMGVTEELAEVHTVVKEDSFGVHVEVRGPPGASHKITYPVFKGMAYISAKFEGGCTPRLSHENIVLWEKVRNGVWRFKNVKNEFRVYAFDFGGSPVDSSFDMAMMDENATEIVMNKQLDGWIRVAQVNKVGDVDALDRHAGAIVLGAELDVFAGEAQYHWKTLNDAELLHFGFPHHVKQMSADSAQIEDSMQRSQAPTKGKMTPFRGNKWVLETNLDKARSVDYLPVGDPDEQHLQMIKDEIKWQVLVNKKEWTWKILVGTFYFSGKQLQKASTLCLMAEKLMGADDEITKTCVSTLGEALKCYYDPVEREQAHCVNASSSYYDPDWFGIATRAGYNHWTGAGAVDFGNAVYNDHHYHWAYFVVASSVLVKMKPEMKSFMPLVNWVNMLIRDCANPSTADSHFPRFRSFDWFDMHSWSRGIPPSPDGKDQESTSEEVNLMYGLTLWAREFQNKKLEDLATTMLSFDVTSIAEYFLMTSENKHVDPSFAKNHVTGIFFANKIDYNTWFGHTYEFIHGVQMLPLTPALSLIRTPEFCKEEWDDVLSKMTEVLGNYKYKWNSLLFTGSLGIARPVDGMEELLKMDREFMDDGLSKAWAVYWLSVRYPSSSSVQASISLLALAAVFLLAY